jgi:hypothetical protein
MNYHIYEVEYSTIFQKPLHAKVAAEDQNRAVQLVDSMERAKSLERFNIADPRVRIESIRDLDARTDLEGVIGYHNRELKHWIGRS